MNTLGLIWILSGKPYKMTFLIYMQLSRKPSIAIISQYWLYTCFEEICNI